MNMILGISGSPRENGITAHAIKEILSQSKEDTQYISLFGKHIDQLVIVNDF